LALQCDQEDEDVCETYADMEKSALARDSEGGVQLEGEAIQS
jgi:hypothetical protein